MGDPKGRASSRRDSQRRTLVARKFDGGVDREWKRYSGEVRRVLQRELLERFLRKHLPRPSGTVLELGSGPGRFSGALLSCEPRTLVQVDISRGGLTTSRKRFRRHPQGDRIRWAQGAGEHLPLHDGVADAAVVFGNIVSFAVDDGPRMVQEVARALKPRGLLLVEFPQPVGSIQETLLAWTRRRTFRKIFRDPKAYFIDQILETGYQPYAPDRLCDWEFQFYTVDQARAVLAKAGLETFDAMSVGPLTAYQEGIARLAQRERATWDQLLRLEEIAGRRVGALECGHGFLLAARTGPRK